MATYGQAVIERLQSRGALGAFWWCWADYDPSLAKLPPFDRAPHELHFGVVRSDGTLKPIAETLRRAAAAMPEATEPPAAIAGEDEHYGGLPDSIEREYRAYCDTHA